MVNQSVPAYQQKCSHLNISKAYAGMLRYAFVSLEELDHEAAAIGKLASHRTLCESAQAIVHWLKRSHLIACSSLQSADVCTAYEIVI